MKDKKELNIQVGIEIRKAREQAGLTQARFGEMMGLDTKNVSDIERGVTGIKLSTLTLICENLHISSDSLLFGCRCENDVGYLIERIKLLPYEQFLIIKELFDKVMETLSLLS